MKRFITAHLSPLLLTTFLVASLPPDVSAETRPPEECADSSGAQDACDPTHSVVVDEYEDEDGDTITVTRTCDLDGASNSLEVVIDDEGVEVNTVLTCTYGNCDEVRHVTNIWQS